MATRRSIDPIGGPPRARIIALLDKEQPATLKALLLAAFDTMTAAQRRRVFDDCIKAHEPKQLDAHKLWKEVGNFDKASRAGEYYAPFDINSKNFMDVPEETEEWCSRMAELIEATVKISKAGEHEVAVDCFDKLLKLIEDMGEKEIVFADELGSWMIPVPRDEPWLKVYILSISAISTPDDFADRVIPILEYDSLQSNSGRAYVSAMAVKNLEQVKKLKSEIKRRKIRVRS